MFSLVGKKFIKNRPFLQTEMQVHPRNTFLIAYNKLKKEESKVPNQCRGLVKEIRHPLTRVVGFLALKDLQRVKSLSSLEFRRNKILLLKLQ